MGEHFGQFLKRKMKEAGITQQELADKVGVARSTVSLYISENTYPSAEVIKRIQDALDLDPLEVLAVTSEKRQEDKNAADDAIRAAYGKDALDFLKDYRLLTKLGKAKIRERMEELSELPKYSGKTLLNVLDEGKV